MASAIGSAVSVLPTPEDNLTTRPVHLRIKAYGRPSLTLSVRGFVGIFIAPPGVVLMGRLRKSLIDQLLNILEGQGE